MMQINHKDTLNMQQLINANMDPVAVLGSARSGKTSAIMAPALLSWQGSSVVTDVRGELLGITGAYRQEKLDNEVRHIDFFDIDSQDSFNFLDVIHVGSGHEVEDVLALSEAILGKFGSKQSAQYWEPQASQLLSLFIIDAVLRKTGNLFSVWTNVSDTSRFEGTISQYWDPENPESELVRVACDAAVAFAELDREQQREVRSILISMLRIFSDEAVSKTTSKSTFQIADLFTGNKPTTIYLTFDPYRTADFEQVARVFLSQVVRYGKRHAGSGTTYATLFALDDFVALGRLECLEDVFCDLKYYGIKPLLAIQNLQALNTVYGSANTIWQQCATTVVLRINDTSTAQAVAKAAGLSDGSNWVTPEQLVMLSPWEAVVLEVGHKPRKVTLVPYFEDATFVECGTFTTEINEASISEKYPLTVYLQAIGGECIGTLPLETYQEFRKRVRRQPKFLLDATVEIGLWSLNQISLAILLLPVFVVWIYLLSLVVPVDPAMLPLALGESVHPEIPAALSVAHPGTPLDFLKAALLALCVATVGCKLMCGKLPNLDQALNRQLQRQLFKSLRLPRWPTKAFYKDAEGYDVPLPLSNGG